MEEVVIADGADFAVAEKSAEADIAEVMLDELPDPGGRDICAIVVATVTCV